MKKTKTKYSVQLLGYNCLKRDVKWASWIAGAKKKQQNNYIMINVIWIDSPKFKTEKVNLAGW